VTLRYKLILALVVLLVPLMVADIYYHYGQYKYRRSEALSAYKESARDLARNTQLLVSRTVAIEKSVAKTLDFAHWNNKTSRHKYLVAVSETDTILSNIAITDASGNVIDGFPFSRSVNISDRAYFRRLKNSKDKDWVVSDLLVNRLDQTAGFIIATAIYRDKQFAGVILTRIDEKRVNQLLSMPEIGDTVLVLADKQGNITFMSNRPDLSYKQRKSRNHYLQLDKKHHYKYLLHTDIFGKHDLNGALVLVSDIGWTAGAFAPAGLNLQLVRHDTLRDILIISAIFIFTIVMGTLFAGQLTSSVTELSRAAEQLGKGHFETRISPPRVSEFALLASTINTMAASIQQRDEALQLAYQRERRISAAFQESMLPDVPKQIGRIELATAYYPALEEAELGGDFYDVNVLPNGLVGLLVADVSGKGLAAAVHTATAKYALQGFAYEDPDPGRVLSRLSAVLYDNSNTDKFITAFYAVVEPDTGRMVYANAGHPQPIIRHYDGSTEWLHIASGPPLGVSRHPEYIVQELQLIENDILVSYTDGVIEARKGSLWFGAEGLEAIMKKGDYSPGDIVCVIHQIVSDFVGGDLPDDIALLAAKMVSDKHD